MINKILRWVVKKLMPGHHIARNPAKKSNVPKPYHDVMAGYVR